MGLVGLYGMTDKFMADYPVAIYLEIIQKIERPYSCIAFEANDGCLICVPFWSHISYKNAFLFKKSEHSKIKKSGLDYSKLIIIKYFKVEQLT